MLRDSKPLENDYATFDTFFGLYNLIPVRSVLYNLKSPFHGILGGESTPFASEYGYAGLWNSSSSYYVCAVIWNFLPTHMFTLLCVSTVGVIYVSCEIWVYIIYIISVFIFCLSCVWLNQIGVAALSVKIEALEKQVSTDSVDRALVCVRQLAGRPVRLSDGTAIVAALESLADVSRSAGHLDFKRHEAILKQCRPLTHDPRLPRVVTQPLGDDESTKIAGQIQKILKSDHLFSAPPPSSRVTLSGASKSPQLSSPTGEWAWPIHSVWLWQLQ